MRPEEASSSDDDVSAPYTQADEPHSRPSSFSSGDEADEAFLSSHPPLPGHKRHATTDRPWLVIFVLALVGLSKVFQHAAKHGDLRRLSHGYNFRGQLCGFEGRGLYVFWCLDPSSGEMLAELPLCVEACPTSANATVCGHLSDLTPGAEAYSSRPFLSYCLPGHTDLVRQVMSRLTGKSIAGKLMTMGAQLQHAKLPLLMSAGLAACLGFVYLQLLDKCAKSVLVVCLTGLVMALMAVGVWLIYSSQFGSEGHDGLPGSGDAMMDMRVGVILLALVPVGCLASCGIVNSIQSAMGCIEAGSECMFQEPSLLLEPFLAMAFRFAMVAHFLHQFCLLISCGELEIEAGGNGVSRRFRHTFSEYWYMCYFVYVAWWMCEFSIAMSQYILAWVTQMWYFAPYVDGHKVDAPRCGLIGGFVNAVRFHIGTLAVGSMYQTLFRGPQLIFGALTGMVQGRRNAVTACIGDALRCGIACFNRYLARFSKVAYLDVAITSSNYVTAASRAFELLSTEVPAVSALHGSQAIFTFIGVAAISCVGFLLTLASVRGCDMFNNPHSLLFVSHPKAVAGCAGVISFFIATSFMTVLDTVTDTVLYCFAVEQRRHRRVRDMSQEAEEQIGCMGPWSLLELLGGGGSGGTPASYQESAPRYAPQRLRKLLQRA